MKYRIGLVQTVVEEATVSVEAATAEEAERVALAAANSGNVEWRFLSAEDPVEIVSVDKE
jgi:hypothetical protein